MQNVCLKGFSFTTWTDRLNQHHRCSTRPPVYNDRVHHPTTNLQWSGTPPDYQSTMIGLLFSPKNRDENSLCSLQRSMHDLSTWAAPLECSSFYVVFTLRDMRYKPSFFFLLVSFFFCAVLLLSLLLFLVCNCSFLWCCCCCYCSFSSFTWFMMVMMKMARTMTMRVRNWILTSC